MDNSNNDDSSDYDLKLLNDSDNNEYYDAEEDLFLSYSQMIQQICPKML